VALVGYDLLKIFPRFVFPMKLLMFDDLFILPAWEGGPDLAPSPTEGHQGRTGRCSSLG